MGLRISISQSASTSTIAAMAGEPMVFSYQDCTSAGVPTSMAGRAFGFAVYTPTSRTKQNYAEAIITTDAAGDIALWKFAGLVTEELYAAGPLRWTIAERMDDGYDPIAQGDLTIEEGPNFIPDFNSAPISRYISKIVRKNDPSTIDRPNFSVSIAAFGAAPVQAPGNLTAPAVTGTPTVGQTLTASTGTWSNAPSGYTYQWLRAGSPIAGATSATYVVVSADQGNSVACRVTATNAGGSTQATSNAISVVVPAPVFSIQPSMSPTSGTAGQTTFTANAGTASNTTSYSRRWLLNGALIGTGTSVQPGSAGNLVLEVTAAGPGGSAIANSPTSVIAAAQVPAPVFSTGPSISPSSGTAGTTTFTATDGTASNTNTYSRRWLLDGVSIGTDPTVQPSTAGSLVLEVIASGAGGNTTAVSTAVTVAAAPVATGNVLPTAALVDTATARANTYGSQRVVLNGGVTLPAADWVMHLGVRLLSSNSYHMPLISLSGSAAPTSGYLGSAPNLQLAFVPVGSSEAADPARGSWILSGRDNANNWLSPHSNRSISSYWSGWGTNVRYLAGPYHATPDNLNTSIFIQKRAGRVELWSVTPGVCAILHDYAASSFGELTAASAEIGRIIGKGTTASNTLTQRFFVAQGSLTAMQMEAIAQGVDPRQYLAFDKPTDILTSLQALGTTDPQPHLVGSGSCQLSASSTNDLFVPATPPIPTTVLADMPRVAIEKDQVIQRTGVISDLPLSGTCSGLDDDIYVQVVDFTNKATIVKSWTKVATTVNGVWSGKITGVPTALQWYDLQIRKGLDGVVYTCNRRFGLGVVLDWWGQSIAEKMRSTTLVNVGGTGSGFISFFSRAKSDSGSTQGQQQRGWKVTSYNGYGEVNCGRMIAEACQCPVGLVMSAMEGSAINAWTRGNINAYVPMVDTWNRVKPGYVVWSQGQGSTGTTPAAYTTFLDTLLANAREDFPWNWKMVMEPLNGQTAQANNAGVFTGLRLAQSNWADANAANGVSNAGAFLDLRQGDNIHPDPSQTGQGRVADRIARQIAFLEGAAPDSAMGPRFVSMTRNGADLDLTLVHNGGTGLQYPDTASPITGFQVSADNWSTYLTISSVSIVDATTVRLTLAAAPTGPVKVRYLYGNPGLTATKTANNVAIEGANCLYDNRSYGLNPTLGFPVMFTTTDLAA